MNEGTLRAVLYMMREEAHLTLKEKKKKKTGGRFLRHENEISFHSKGKGTITKKKDIFRYIKQRLR